MNAKRILCLVIVAGLVIGGSAAAQVRRMGPGQVFVPLAVNANDAMNLFDLTDLADPNATGWKTCAVKIKKA